MGHANLAAAAASGEHLVFMDWGLHALERQWLNALLEYSQQEPIGAVGAKLFYPDGSLKHIGIVLGVNGVAARPFDRHPRSSMGYWGTAIAARNYSAVSGVCMMTRRDVFQQVGGFREEMRSLADVDYCLSATGAGYRIVFTPHAELTHDDPRPAPPGALGRGRREPALPMGGTPVARPLLQCQSQSYFTGLRTGSLSLP